MGILAEIIKKKSISTHEWANLFSVYLYVYEKNF